MLKLREKYPEIFEIFDGDLDKFMNYCQELIDEIHKNRNENLDLINIDDIEKKFEMKNDNNQINDLSNLIFENFKNENQLFKDRKIFYSNYEVDKRFYINYMMERYFEQENLQMKKIKIEEQEKIKIEIKKKEKQNSLFLDSENAIKRGNEKFWLKITEFSLIISLFYLCYLMLNNILIKELSIFSSKIIDIFDEKQYCINKFKRITSADDLNNWMLDCYMVTYDSKYLYKENYF